jgi:hypothetical protein
MSDRLVPSRQQFFVSCANGLLFSATFIISCLAIGRSLPFPDVPVVRSKLAHFAAHRDEYDTLFLGSSHFYYQIIPSLFDGVAAENGYPTRSFNAGIAGMRPPEDGYLLERFSLFPPEICATSLSNWQSSGRGWKMRGAGGRSIGTIGAGCK